MVMMVGMASEVSAEPSCGAAENNDAMEWLCAEFTGSQIHSWAWNFKLKNDGTPFYYQFRYAQPGTDPETANLYDSISNPDGYFVSIPPFLGEGTYNQLNPKDYYFPPTLPGDVELVPGSVWTVALYKGGGPNSNPTILTSIRVRVPLTIIPEFSTVAIPIAAVLGLVFFFQHRKKKEE